MQTCSRCRQTCMESCSPFFVRRRKTLSVDHALTATLARVTLTREREFPNTKKNSQLDRMLWIFVMEIHDRISIAHSPFIVGDLVDCRLHIAEFKILQDVHRVEHCLFSESTRECVTWHTNRTLFYVLHRWIIVRVEQSLHYFRARLCGRHRIFGFESFVDIFYFIVNEFVDDAPLLIGWKIPWISR